MTPEEHRRARAAHENALCRSIWLKMARDASLDAGYALVAWEGRGVVTLVLTIGIATTCGVLGIWVPEIPWIALPIELLGIERAWNYIRTGHKTAQFWLRVRQQRLDYAEMYR